MAAVVDEEFGSIPGRTGWRRLSAGEGTAERPPPLDIVVAAVLGLGLVVETVLVTRAELVDPLVPVPVGVLLALVVATPLAWRRVVPLVTIAVSGPATGLFTMLGYELGVAGLTLLVALYSIAAYGTRRDAQISLAITAGFVVVSLAVAWVRHGGLEPIGAVVTALILGGAWAFGDRTRARRQVMEQLRVRAEEAERQQELVRELAAADERRRIARELHDIVAHAVSVVVVQASAGRRIADRDPSAAIPVLEDIEDSGREALAELRRLVTVLRDGAAAERPDGPQPTVEDIRELVQRLAEAGVPIRLLLNGQPSELPSGIEVSAYRIVQESLTNVLKHAGKVSEVVVIVDQDANGLDLTITDDGRGVRPPPAPDGPEDGAERDRVPGAKLVGMRERVALFGGSLHAGPRETGGFEVRAHLPCPRPLQPGSGLAGEGA
ncbi:MAG: sensor histidine kinase [Nitriliruptoraceae bacterium]